MEDSQGLSDGERREELKDAEKLLDDSNSSIDSSSSSSNDDSDSDSDTDSQISSISDILQLAIDPASRSWIQSQLLSGASPRAILGGLLGSDSAALPDGLCSMSLWYIISFLSQSSVKRPKLSHINTVTDVVRLMRQSKRVIVLTGAGVSVSCGIPDFRSRDGIYRRLAADFPDLTEPQAMFDISYFSRDPRPFYRFARDIYPGQFEPSPCHRFIRHLERCDRLLRNYTQNIDTLERVAGIERVIECHGSFGTASCTRCRDRVPSSAIAEDIRAQRIPLCRLCHPGEESPSAAGDLPRELVASGIMKPDIVFFGEGLPSAFHDAIMTDRDACDLLIVIGSSLKVRPVALIPSSVPPHVPQILINREPLPHMRFDVELLGDSDVIIDHLCQELGGEWKDICWRDTRLTERPAEGATVHPPKLSPSGDTLDGVPELNQVVPAAPSCHRDDSGIGESSNSTDSPEATWKLPADTFCRVEGATYIFPGAEYERQPLKRRSAEAVQEESELAAKQPRL
ncbi:NAD-dependent histone deacetylase sirtuin-1 [Phlebotomus argentipes]|uniref:NAD-dependent histone deacetylase sirtuin-1 n=1 Tax=Phlebotomus argentipes TaxID=94469 RepID=UPI0028929834|nr:NAD-dependent histone deacetylase sirtuin-1 [Phlebotomus argentipes]